MEAKLIEVVGGIAGIGGIAFGVFFFICRDVIRKKIFPNLTKQQAYDIIRMLLVLSFLLAIAGIAAWLASKFQFHWGGIHVVA